MPEGKEITFTLKLNRQVIGGLVVGLVLGSVLTVLVAKLGNNGGSGGSATVRNSAPTAAAPAPAPAPTRPSAGGAIQLAAITDDDHIRGNRNAQISVVEFSDTECPFCKRFHPTMQQVLQTYGDKVNWVYRHFPLDSIHPKARKEAEATECASELGGNDKFWAYVDRLFEVTPSNNGLDPAQLPQIAQDVGLNRAKFEDCLNSGKYASKVQEHLNDAITSGGQGTPYSVIVVGDQKIPVSGAVPFAQLQSILDGLVQ